MLGGDVYRDTGSTEIARSGDDKDNGAIWEALFVVLYVMLTKSQHCAII